MILAVALLAAASSSPTPEPTGWTFDQTLQAFEHTLDTQTGSLDGIPVGATVPDLLRMGARVTEPDEGHAYSAYSFFDSLALDGDTLLTLRRPGIPMNGTVTWVAAENGVAIHLTQYVLLSSGEAAQGLASFDRLATALRKAYGEPQPVTLDLPAVRGLFPLAQPSAADQAFRWVHDGYEVLLYRNSFDRLKSIYLTVSPIGPDATEREIRSGFCTLLPAEKLMKYTYGTYSTDLRSANWGPRTFPHAVFGFCEPFPDRIDSITDYQPRRSTSDLASVRDGLRESGSGLTDVGDVCAALRRLGLADRYRASADRFTAFGVGRLGPGDEGLEVFSLDQDGVVRELHRASGGLQKQERP